MIRSAGYTPLQVFAVEVDEHQGLLVRIHDKDEGLHLIMVHP